jgi:hypothetical protein
VGAAGAVILSYAAQGIFPSIIAARGPRTTGREMGGTMKAERAEWEGHQIELRHGERRLELLIDGAPKRYGQLPGGLYFLHDYAYDWSDDLMEVARRYIAYRRRVDEGRGQESRRKQGK